LLNKKTDNFVNTQTASHVYQEESASPTTKKSPIS